MRKIILMPAARRVGRLLGDAVIVSGLALIAFGAFEIYRPAGFIVAGVELATLGWLLDRG